MPHGRGAYKSGHYMPGWNEIVLDTGKTIYLPDNGGFASMLDKAEALGYDVTEQRQHIANWVKTGQGGKF